MYPGGKEGAGVYQTIINQIPPHQTYIEGFAGGAAILRLKRPAEVSVAIDADAAAVEQLSSLDLEGQMMRVVHGSALDFLRDYSWTGREFVYLDPPYLMSTRMSGREIYAHEMHTDAQHLDLLSLIRTIPAAVMISGYWSALYQQHLCDWRTVTFQTTTRGGRPATEWLWCNYPEPTVLHDWRYIGRDYRERERIKRKIARHTARLSAMPLLERQALMAALEQVGSTAPSRVAVRSSSSILASGAPIVGTSGIVEGGEGTR